MGFKDHFSGHAAAYAAHRPTWPEALVDVLADGSPGCELAWDVGCGSGQLSTLLPRRFASVIATDASAEQLEHALPAARLTYRCAPAEQSGLPSHSADCIVVAQAAHWFDIEAFYADARRTLAPSGAIALVTYGVIEVDGDVGAILHRFYHDIIGPFWRPERRHVEMGYRSLPFPFAEAGFPKLAMRKQWPLEAFAVDLRAAWGDPAQAREIRWPLRVCPGTSCRIA